MFACFIANVSISHFHLSVYRSMQCADEFYHMFGPELKNITGDSKTLSEVLRLVDQLFTALKSQVSGKKIVRHDVTTCSSIVVYIYEWLIITPFTCFCIIWRTFHVRSWWRTRKCGSGWRTNSRTTHRWLMPRRRTSSTTISPTSAARTRRSTCWRSSSRSKRERPSVACSKTNTATCCEALGTK